MKDKRIEIRPKLNIVSEDEYISFSERFSNTTLRPIIKLQHDLFIAVFKNNAKSRKLILKNISNQKMIAFVDNLLFKDSNFRQLVIGLVIGHFTIDEYNQYIDKTTDLDKIIISLIDESMHDSLLALKK
jgi:hypothetical protein